MRHSQHSFRKALSLAYGGGKEAQWFSVMQRLEQVELSPEEVGGLVGMGGEEVGWLVGLGYVGICVVFFIFFVVVGGKWCWTCFCLSGG